MVNPEFLVSMLLKAAAIRGWRRDPGFVSRFAEYIFLDGISFIFLKYPSAERTTLCWRSHWQRVDHRRASHLIAYWPSRMIKIDLAS
jgi:hypothetical protein